MPGRDEIDALAARVAALETELAAARESGDVLAGVLAAVPAIVMRVDAELMMRDISRVVRGMRYEDVRDTPFLEHVPPAERDKIRDIYARVLTTGAPEHYETVGPGPDGSTSAYDSYVARIADRHGVHALVVVAIDVTDRIARDRAFVASEAYKRLAVEATGLGLWSFDVASGSVTWNDAMYRICGVTTALSPAEYTARVVHPDDRARAAENSAGFLEVERFQDRATRIVRPDGEVRWVVNTGRVLRDASGAPTQVIGTTLDVTAERMMDERLRQSQRLEAVGQLAAGVAHNFNNILASIVPVLDLVAPHVPDRYRALVEGASHSAGRAADLVRQLMTFAGQRAGATRRVERLAELADRAVRLCKPLIDARIVLSIEDTSDGACVRCDPGAIEQSIVNLVLNARDAIDETARGSGAVRILVGRAPQGSTAFVRVSDDGVGMAPDVSRRIFEPFFTTKDVGRGTGLGLPVTYATARDHGGTITCVSEVSVGSTLELVLPLATGSVETSTAAQAPVVATRHAILLVDDDDDVRTSTTALLQDLGQSVIATSTAGEALTIAQTTAVTLVLLDRAMPMRSGDAIVPALRRALPTTPIVFFTGEDVDDDARAAVDAVLLKPASRPELITLLERAGALVGARATTRRA